MQASLKNTLLCDYLQDMSGRMEGEQGGSHKLLCSFLKSFQHSTKNPIMDENAGTADFSDMPNGNQKFERLYHKLMSKMKTKVRYMQGINIKIGVKLGCLLSLTLFRICLKFKQIGTMFRSSSMLTDHVLRIMLLGRLHSPTCLMH